MRKFQELHRHEFEQFLERFSIRGSLKFRNNKWIGLTRDGKPFTVHVKHGTTRKYSSRLVEAVAKDLSVTLEEFEEWCK
jgi:phosphoenolpyruvate carboxylase